MTISNRHGVAALAAVLLLLGAAPLAATAQNPDVPLPSERTAARAWFQDAKFGMFIHWGVYSLLGQGEWVMQNRSIPVSAYEWLASTFNPVKFNAHDWVALAKSAGVRYITITSRHHDGFSMFATHATPYNIVDWTPFHRDPLKELADECHAQGIKLFFYYSQLDWHNPDYWPRGGTGHNTGRPDAGDWNRYIDFMNGQLTELLTNYGAVGGIWFDGMWDKPDADWQLPRTYALIHRLQPAALIVPNHHRAPLPGEDVQTFEQDLPGANTAGFNTRQIGALPLETSLTMNESWGFNITDSKFKSTRELIGYLVRAAGANANLLLNIGPRPDGTIQPEAAERLRAIGEWLGKYGRSIYGTRGGPVPPREWGVTTRRGDTVFVHILNWPDRVLSLPDFGVRVVRATMLNTGQAVDVTQLKRGIAVTLPAAELDSPDRIIVLETRGSGVAQSAPSSQSSPAITPSSIIPVFADDLPGVIQAKAANVIPSPQHLAWQRRERLGFIHFGINTFTDREWGTGSESPTLFNPSALDARQWMRAFRSAGITEVVLVVKHHDGFSLYPSRYTTHSVKASPWLGGRGDVMRAFTSAAKEFGLKVGFYLSPADLYQKQQGIFGNGSAAVSTQIPTLVSDDDRHPRQFLTYQLDDYNRYFMNQMYELLTEYGPISEVWLDGAPAAGSGQPYAFAAWYDIVHRLQPNAVIFNQNVRWVGNEDGLARETEWSVVPLAHDYNLQPSGDLTDADLGSRDKLVGRDVHFLAWYPAEADVSIRPGWFWHATQNDSVKTLGELMKIYYGSVGRNATLMLNVPPDRRGLFTDVDVRRLKEFGDQISSAFERNLAPGALKSAKNRPTVSWSSI